MSKRRAQPPTTLVNDRAQRPRDLKSELPADVGSSVFVWGPTAWVAALTAVGGVFHFLLLARYAEAPLWFDEAHTAWMIRGTFAEIARRCASEVYPPLYFWIVSVVARVFGDSETSLRLFSSISATAVTPVIFAVTRRLAGDRTALVAAALAAFSPILTYYSVEARCYAFLALMCGITFGAYLRILASPKAYLPWIVFALSLSVALHTHHYAVFVCPAPTLTTLFLPIPDRMRMAVRFLALSLISFLPYSYWFLIAASAREGTEWIALYWRGWHPMTALFESLELFGYGAAYPHYLWDLSGANPIPFVGLAVTLGLLTLATLRWRDAPDPQAVILKRAAWGFLAIPLLIPFTYSHLRRPIYMPGRYDLIALVPFLTLLAIGLEKLLRDRNTRWWGSSLVGAGLLFSLWSAWTMARDAPISLFRLRDPVIVRELAGEATPADLVVCIGHRYMGVQHFAPEYGLQAELVTFPSDVREHPGTYSPLAERYRLDPERLPREAREVASVILDRLENGGRVWILENSSWNDRTPQFLDDALGSRVALAVFAPRRYAVSPKAFGAYRAVLRRPLNSGPGE